MLKAAIVYVQGSAGSLVNRSLTLDPETIALLPVEHAEEQHVFDISTEDRMQLYSNWNHLDWKFTELHIRTWYQRGKNNFVNYELSPKFLISAMHPCMFYNDNNAEVWTQDNFWENIIFIDWEPESLGAIIDNAKAKRPDLEHAQQIPNEVKTINELKEQYNGLSISWESIQQVDTYLTEISRLATELGLNINIDLVEQLWHSWNTETKLILKKYSK